MSINLIKISQYLINIHDDTLQSADTITHNYSNANKKIINIDTFIVIKYMLLYNQMSEMFNIATIKWHSQLYYFYNYYLFKI